MTPLTPFLLDLVKKVIMFCPIIENFDCFETDNVKKFYTLKWINLPTVQPNNLKKKNLCQFIYLTKLVYKILITQNNQLQVWMLSFLTRNAILTIFSQQILSNKLLLFLISEYKSNFNCEFKLKLRTSSHLRFFVKILCM